MEGTEIDRTIGKIGRNLELVMIYWYRKYCKGCVVVMKKLLPLVMVLALVMIPSMCFAQKEFPDGTVLNDKEEFVYEFIEGKSRRLLEPSALRFKQVCRFDLEKCKSDKGILEIGLSLKNSSGGRTLMTYVWFFELDDVHSFEGLEADYMQDKDVDLAKLNHLWKTYHAEDD